MSFLKPINIINWYIKHAHGDITVKRACNLLSYALKSGGEVVKFDGKEVSLWELGAHPELAERPATMLKIKFIGGPPGAYNIYDGTLWNYVIDRVLWELIHHDASHLRTLNGMCREVTSQKQTADAS